MNTLSSAASKRRLAATLALAFAASAATPVSAQALWDGPWKVTATLYAYLPKVDGNFAFPRRGGDDSIDVNAQDFVGSLNGAFLGALDFHNGRVGFFTDYMYLDVSGSKSGTRNFSVGNGSLPASVTGDLDLGVKGHVWTLAGEYRLITAPGYTMDVLLGARQLDVKPRLSFTLNGDLSGIPANTRGGSREIEANNWDGIIGVRGRWDFASGGGWYVPYYADIGTGESDLTVQAAGGLGYAFSWGDIAVQYRYLHYNIGTDKPVKNLTFTGPQFGVSIRF